MKNDYVIVTEANIDLDNDAIGAIIYFLKNSMNKKIYQG